MVDLGWGIPWRALVQWVVNAAKLWLKMEYLGGLPPWLHPLNWSVYMTTIPVERDTLMHCPTLQFPQRIIHLNINISDVFVEQTTTCDIGEIAKLKSQLPKAIYFSESETIFFMNIMTQYRHITWAECYKNIMLIRNVSYAFSQGKYNPERLQATVTDRISQKYSHMSHTKCQKLHYYWWIRYQRNLWW